MIGNWEIYARASTLLARDGAAAHADALARAQMLLEAGQFDGHCAFTRIAAAIDTLQVTATEMPTH